MTTDSTCCTPPDGELDLVDLDSLEADERLAELARALGHPARVKIVRMLVRKSVCVAGEFVEELPLAQSTVSQHLKKLKDIGLIQGEIDGPRVCYCIDPSMLRQLKVLVAAL